MARPSAFQDDALARVLLAPIKLALAIGAIASGVLVAAVLVQWLWLARPMTTDFGGIGGEMGGAMGGEIDSLHALHTPVGLDSLDRLLRQEVSAGISLAERQGRSPYWITAPANALYALIFEATGLHAMGQRFADPAQASIPDTVVRRAWVAQHEVVAVAMRTTQLVGVRVAILLHLTPWLALMVSVGIIDGLTRRGVRRDCGGAESASLYHRAKYAQVTVLGLGAALLLVWPLPVAWTVVSALAGAALAWLASAQWGYYKKRV
jgi:hypothetical protein